MRRLSGAIALMVLVFLPLTGFISTSASAETNSNTVIPACNSSGIASGTTVCRGYKAQSGNTVIKLIKDAIDILSFAVGVISVIIIIVSGIRFATSGGESNAVAGAKKGLLGAVIGIVVVVLAQSIVIFVLDNIIK